MPAPTYTTAKFGGRPLPGTGVVAPWVDMVNGGAWSLDDIQPGDAPRSLGTGQLLWRGRGVWLSEDFGMRTVTLPTQYKESSGTPLSSALGTLSQAGEQYLTFDTATYLSVKYAGFTSRTLRRKFAPLWWKGTLVFKAVNPWARDFQLSGSLANLLNPYGGFEGPLVQPTLYGSTVLFSDGFETSGATVNYFTGVGTDAKEPAASINDWTPVVGAAWSKAANVLTSPAAPGTEVILAVGSGGTPGALDATLYTFVCQSANSAINSAIGAYVQSNGDGYYAVFGGGNVVRLYKRVSGVYTQIGPDFAFTYTVGNSVWLRIDLTTAGKITVSAALDSAGAPGAWTAFAQQSDATYTQGGISLRALTNTASFGSAHAGVCTVTGDGRGWTPYNSDGGTNYDAFFYAAKDPYYDTWSGKVFCPAGGTVDASHRSGWSKTTTTVAATVYRFSLAAKAPSASLNWQYRLGGGLGSGGINGTGAWDGTTSFSGTPGANATFYCLAAGPGTFAFDAAYVLTPNTPTGILFSSLGASAFGWTPYGNSLAAHTLVTGSVASISNGQVSVPTNTYYKSAHPDMWDSHLWMRVQNGSGTNTPRLLLRMQDQNNWYGCQFNGDFRVEKSVSGTLTALQTTGYAGTAGSWYWIHFSCVGTTIAATLYKDAGGYPGDSVASVSVTDSALATGAAGFAGVAGTGILGGNYPGTFLVQGPLPTGISCRAISGEPAFCWSKNSPFGGTYCGSVYLGASGADGRFYFVNSFGDGASTYAVAGQIKLASGSTGSAFLDSDSGSVVFSSPSPIAGAGWASESAQVVAPSSEVVGCRYNGGTGTAYFDNVQLQQTFDSQTGLYAGSWADQVPLVNGTTTGAATSFSLTYAGSVFAEPKFVITIPASNPAPISSIVLKNTTSGETLTLTFSPVLAASTAYTLTIDCAAWTISDQNNTNYDLAGSFPLLYGPPGTANAFTCTVTTSSGTASGLTLDTSWQNRWEA